MPRKKTYQVSRTVNGASGNFKSIANQYDVTNKAVDSNGSGTASGFTTKSGNYYIGDPRNYTDGQSNFISRSVYTVNFKSNTSGKYTFCEKITIEGASTTSCAEITVEVAGASSDPPVTSCPITKPTGTATIDYGTSSTNSGVQNFNIPKYAGWNRNLRLVYAKPNDVVQYAHCLYSGAQTVRHNSSHGAHGGSSGTPNGSRSVITAGSNTMTVTGFNFWGSKTFSYDNGKAGNYFEISNKYKIKVSDVGSNLDQASSPRVGSASATAVDSGWTYYWPEPLLWTDVTAVYWSRKNWVKF